MCIRDRDKASAHIEAGARKVVISAPAGNDLPTIVFNTNHDKMCIRDRSTDDFRQGLMNMAAPAYAQTRFFSIQKTIDIIGKASPAQHIAIICETPQDVLRLVEGGVPIKKVNIGNMHMAAVSYTHL